jgi:hypothetical protein
VKDLESVGTVLGTYVKKSISWRQLYNFTNGAGPTGLKEINKLRAAGWELDPGNPLPQVY